MPEKPRRVLVMSDTHGVHADRRAVEAFFRVAEHVEPERVDHIGDLYDMYTVSKYDKDPDRVSAMGIQREVRTMAPVLARLAEHSRKEPVRLYMGNHDARLESYLRHNAPALHGLRGLSFRELMGIPEEWQVYPYGQAVRDGKLFFTHGGRVRSEGAASGLANRMKTGASVIMGHSHRLGSAYHSDATGTFGAWEIGHLSKPPVYTNEPVNWQQGFALVTFHGSDFMVDLVPVRNGRAWYNGEWI